MRKIKSEIPIFFSTDDNYIPCLSVAIHSLEANASDENNYRIIILHTGMSILGKMELKRLETDNVRISFQNISHITNKMSKDLKLRLRDYYSETIYYRMFIPSMFPEYEKAIYLDGDIILQDDIANLFNLDLKDNLLGAAIDYVVNTTPEFVEYSDSALGLPAKHYFNSGVLVMNLREMRKARIEEKFITMLLNYNLDTIAPDQDYLNVLCKDRVTYFPDTWNKMPDFGKMYDINELHLIHYNMYRKPWHYKDMPYEEAFWKYAKETSYYEKLLKERSEYTDKQKEDDIKAGQKLIDYAVFIQNQEIKFKDIVEYADEDDDLGEDLIKEASQETV